jgi:hypothetical protein
MMSFVVNSLGAAPVGAETVGTSPAFAETVGRESDAGAVDADGVVESDEFISIAPKAARATKARASMDATIARGLFMRCTLSFSPYFFLLPRLH